jgi:N-acetylneuraminic acid mutarotase
MHTRRIGAIALTVVCLGGTTAAQEQIDIQNWSAPPYWAPAAQPQRDGAAGEPAEAEATALEPLALPTEPLPFIAVAPCRLIDTRGPVGTYGGPALVAGAPRSFPVAGQCGVAADAGAISVNATVTNTQGAGFVALYQEGGSFPGVSNVNYSAAWQTVANAAVVPLGPGGFTALAGVSGTDLIVDVNGYYAPRSVVASLTGGASTLTGDVMLEPGANVSITASGNTLTIGAVAGAGAPPSGPAGGSLAGTYPDPGIATGAVGPTQLASATAVRSINGTQDVVTLQGSGNVTVATAGSTITIGAPPGSMVLGPPSDPTLIGAGYSEVAPTSINYWTATATIGAPTARSRHTAVWTGSEMIVWGGYDSNVYPYYHNEGGRYDPVTNTWMATSTTGAPQARGYHTAVWTGSRMIVWGGVELGGNYLNDGGLYDPVGNTWTAMSTTGAPSARHSHTAVWTGSRMIVWGGVGIGYRNDGGVYDPVANTWTATATDGAPTARHLHSAIWTGTGMIVWGGLGGSGFLNSGGAYNPVEGTWSAPTSTGAPCPRSNHTAVWTGTGMIVWGGWDGTTPWLNDGGLYDPAGNTWTATTTTGAPSMRELHTAIWTGSRMVVWGGVGASSSVNDGGQYNPMANAWAAVALPTAPSARRYHTAVWTGTRMIVWGGNYDGSTYLNDGGQWIPVSLYVKQ